MSDEYFQDVDAKVLLRLPKGGFKVAKIYADENSYLFARLGDTYYRLRSEHHTSNSSISWGQMKPKLDNITADKLGRLRFSTDDV